jgi:hypothetical protein
MDRPNRSYPFSQELIENRRVLYHGSWSTYGSRIEAEGLAGQSPFDLEPFLAISKAFKAIGGDPSFSIVDGLNGKIALDRCALCFTPSFWGARSYATDGGGEIVRLAIKDAISFERIFTDPTERANAIAHWEEGVRIKHGPTLAAVAVLEDDAQMSRLHADAKSARQQLEALGAGGYPIVYAVRVEPSWFRDRWEEYIQFWSELGTSGLDLQCKIDIPPDRLVGRADYPNGTERSFDPTFITTWSQVQEI